MDYPELKMNILDLLLRYTEMHPQSPDRSQLAADDPGLSSAAVLMSLYDYDIRSYPVEGEEKARRNWTG
jgi:hypothetical protein